MVSLLIVSVVGVRGLYVEWFDWKEVRDDPVFF